MIKLERPNRPVAFTAAIEHALIAIYLESNKPVWHDAPGVVDALRTMSREKCAYCEASIAERNTPSEIDHFVSKDNDPTRVVEWTNLLPCCRGCNSRKGTHDVLAEPIINPCDIDPKQHLLYADGYFRPKTALGKTTLRALDFTLDRKLMRAIYELTLQANNRLEELAEKAAAEPPPTKGNLTRLRNRIAALMEDGQAKEKFAAAVSTAILRSPDYVTVKAFLQQADRWDAELQNLEDTLQSHALL